MRFAYIDSQGNELPIPSVDALALRIELGAIGPDTQLYDAQADRWGPAHTHEIFHTLSRDISGEEGFVAPPPPVAPPSPPAAEEPAAPSAPVVESEDAADAVPSISDLAPADGDGDADAPVFDLSGGVELEGSGPEEASIPETPPGQDEGLGLDLTLAPMEMSGGDEDFGAGAMDLGVPDASAAEESGEEEESGGFNFGDMGALELEAPSMEKEEPGEAAMDLSGSGMAADEPGDTMDFGGGLELEQPMSEFSADAPPSWMEQDSEEEGTMSFDRAASAASDEADHRAASSGDAEPDEERRERRTPRSRPSPPRRQKKAPVGMIVGVVGIAVLAGGGYFGWKTFAGGSSAREVENAAPLLPAVTIPDIPVEFLPQMRDLGEAALSDMIVELRGLEGASGLPAEPRDDWLAGVYLANASQFRDVQEYWEGIEALVNRVRDSDTRVFHDKYVAQLEAAGITGDTAAMLLERADSGFLATRDDRFEAYALMDDLVNAALDLHRFLLQNEANISYEPAAGGVSRDPVLEAVPSSREIGNQMWNMVDRITGALDALGTLDRVTTERLSAVLFDRIRRAGFQ